MEKTWTPQMQLSIWRGQCPVTGEECHVESHRASLFQAGWSSGKSHSLETCNKIQNMFMARKGRTKRMYTYRERERASKRDRRRDSTHVRITSQRPAVARAWSQGQKLRPSPLGREQEPRYLSHYQHPLGCGTAGSQVRSRSRTPIRMHMFEVAS